MGFREAFSLKDQEGKQLSVYLQINRGHVPEWRRPARIGGRVSPRLASGRRSEKQLSQRPANEGKAG